MQRDITKSRRNLLNINTNINITKLDENNFCPFDKQSPKEIVIHETLNEVDNLVSEYHQISLRLRYIRGRLYSLGIDPEKNIKS